VPFLDFTVLYQTGKDLWNGLYTGLYPLPANGLFALWALFPEWATLAALLITSLALFVAVFKRKALLWVFYVPVLQVLWMGQIDLLSLWLLAHFSPVSLALLTLKPQLFILAIPLLLKRKELWKPFVAWCAVLYVPITLVRPTWILEWIRQMNDGRLSSVSDSFWQVPLLAIIVLVTLIVTRKISFNVLYWCFNPTLRWYDFSLLAGKSYWLIPASWIIVWFSQQRQPDLYWTYALLGLVTIQFSGKLQPCQKTKVLVG